MLQIRSSISSLTYPESFEESQCKLHKTCSFVTYYCLQCGFFRRRQHEKLQRQKRESARLPLSNDDVIDESLPIDARATSASCLDVSGKDSGSRAGSRAASEYDNDGDTSLSVGGYRPENISKFGAREKY
jgi:hypothetical protein